MFFLNGFFVPLFWLINPFAIIKSIKRSLNKGRADMTQREANELMEDYPYSIGKRYAEIIETLWFTFLYLTLIPFGAFLSLIGILLYYWVDKFNLLRRSTLHVQIKGSLTNFSLFLLDFTLLFRGIGEIIFDIEMRGHYHISTGILIALAAIY